MEVNSVNLMQYAVGGASLFILIAVGIIALFIKGREGRIEKKEEAARKKEEQSPLQQTSQKQQTNQKQQINERQQVKQPQKVVQQKEVAPQVVNNQNQQELQELQQRQIMHKLRQNQQEHVKQAMQTPPVQPRVNQQVEPSLQAQQNQEVNLRQQVQQNQEINLRQQVQQEPKLNENRTLEIAFYKVQTTGRGENKAFFLDEYLNVGRTEGINDWVIDDDPTVSGSHCRIYQKNGQLYVADLRSTNGTYVNEERVFGEMKLENHDKIRMGQSTYRIKF